MWKQITEQQFKELLGIGIICRYWYKPTGGSEHPDFDFLDSCPSSAEWELKEFQKDFEIKVDSAFTFWTKTEDCCEEA